MSKIKKRILFLGKDKDIFSKKFITILKKKFYQVDIYLSKNFNDKPRKKLLRWKGDIIISFRNHYLLNSRMIKSAKICAINFHPGPPEYRGIGCINFALLKNEKKYGATVHLIEKKVDNGKILDVSYLKIKKNQNIDQILRNTYIAQISQLKKILKKLIYYKFEVKKLFIKKKWSKKLYLRKNLEKLYNIKPNLGKKKFFSILRATNTKNFKPFIYLHGCKFKLVNEE
tara:strand:+ start:17477 stop:18160 length:684 start_codon:yes stop_codon:yes gene_type:complete